MCLICSYLNTEVVRKSRQCKITVDFYKIGIEYEGARTEIGEVRTSQCCFHSQFFLLLQFLLIYNNNIGKQQHMRGANFLLSYYDMLLCECAESVSDKIHGLNG